MDDENTAKKLASYSGKKSEKKPKPNPLSERYPRDFIEGKPWMPSLMTKNCPRNILMAEKFFKDFIDPIGEFESDLYRQRLKYCTGCESFFRSELPIEIHPKDEVITMDELYHDFGVKCPKSFFAWVEENFVYENDQMPHIKYIRLPGYERYHYTYSELAKGYSIQDKALMQGAPLDYDKLCLEALVIQKDMVAEKTTVDLHNSLFGPPSWSELETDN